MASRPFQILAGIRWATRFDNSLEILVSNHVFRRRRALTLVHQGMPVLIDGLSSDAHVVTDVLLDGMYDEYLRTASEGRPLLRYLNLGANIGTFDLRAAQIASHGCAGAAVEMNPATYARLVVNLETNNLTSVRAINAAAWDAVGEVRVAIEARDTGQRCENSERGWPVPMLPWAALFEAASCGEPLDLVKIDIEGAEERVVPCLTAADAANIRFLVVETHGAAARVAVNCHLQGLGFRQLSEVPGSGQTHLGHWQGVE